MATKKRGSRFCALTLVLWLLCVCVLLLCFLPFREFLLPLLAVIVFAYFGDEETGKGFYDGRWKLNIIFVPFVFLICQNRTTPESSVSKMQVIFVPYTFFVVHSVVGFSDAVSMDSFV